MSWPRTPRLPPPEDICLTRDLMGMNNFWITQLFEPIHGIGYSYFFVDLTTGISAIWSKHPMFETLKTSEWILLQLMPFCTRLIFGFSNHELEFYLLWKGTWHHMSTAPLKPMNGLQWNFHGFFSDIYCHFAPIFFSIFISSPGHRPCELLSWVSVRPSVR